jgi:hypothetical protein
MALERAWGHWRVMHGLGTDPLPPVSSYVGYSLEEPWGQPRVVFGVGAEEAERLAALLAGHDCYGPVHAEVTARPDWRLAAGGPATAQGRPFDSAVSVPAQAPPPGAEPVAERDVRHVAGATGTGAPGADTALGYDADAYADTAYGADAYGDIAYAEHSEGAEDAEVVSYEADPLTIHHERAGGDRADPDDAAADSPPRSWEHGEPAGTVHLAAVEQPGVIAFPRRPQQPADQWQEPAPASDSNDAMPSQGPGYCGPRYQGFPPQYQPGPSQQEPPALFGSHPEAEPTDAGESGATQARAAGHSAVQRGADQPGADQPASGPGAGQPSATKPEAVQADASPAVVRAKQGPSRDSEPTGGEPEAVQSAAVQSRVAQAKGGQSGGRQSRARHVSVDAREAGRSGAVQSREGQSREGQSGLVQPSTVQSGTGPETPQHRVAEPRAVQPKAVPSKSVQPKALPSKSVQPKALPSKSVQPRQTSRPSSPGRATGEGTGKRPRG